MKHKELSEKIIGCAYRVYNKMGFGFLESVYEKCLLIELREAGLQAEAQAEITVYYEKEIVGEFIADIIVENLVILELKSVRRVAKAHEVQLVTNISHLHILSKDMTLDVILSTKRKDIISSSKYPPCEPHLPCGLKIPYLALL